MICGFRHWLLMAAFSVFLAFCATAQGTPHWIAKKNRFWYRKQGTNATEFLRVDADQNTTGPAFDHTKLAASLSKELKREILATDLPFDFIDFSDDAESVSFQVDGATWSPATNLNTGPVHNGAEHFFQWMAVDPAGGSVNVIFYDRRGDPRNRAQTVTLARSTDSGQSFQNYSWTEQPFNARGGFIGDYNGLAGMNGRVYGIWTEKPENVTTRDTIIRIGVADFPVRLPRPVILPPLRKQI